MSDPKDAPEGAETDVATPDADAEDALDQVGGGEEADAEVDEDDDESPAEDADAEDDGEGDGAPAPPAREGKRDANSRIRDLDRRLRDTERERDELKRQPAVDHAAQQRAYEEREAAALAKAKEAEQLGDTGAVGRYYYERTQREGGARYQQLRNETFERDDAREFRLLCRTEGVSKSVADFVEGVIATARSNGNYQATREMVLNIRLGQLSREGRGARRQKQEDRGQRRIQSQTVRAPRGGSDAAAPSRRSRDESKWSTEDYERELANRPIFK